MPGYEKGVLSIKVSDNFSEELESLSNDLGEVTIASVKSMESIHSQLDIISMVRIFPPAGKFEKRTKEADLHKWYRVEFNKNLSLTKAYDLIDQLDEVEIIEFTPEIQPIRSQAVILDNSEDKSSQLMIFSTNNSPYPFNDPYLSKQWHYYNDGSLKSSRYGADINVVPAWKNYKTGNPEIIISVVDEGIDFRHEDLIDNMWNNPSQSFGDFKYGYNFVQKSYEIVPGSHGTHVAGIISAVNNNSKGVSGIAGGDAAKGIPGVKLMSCQIFQGEEGADGANAIKWGADHGAVISQNSWGYIHGTIDYTPQYMKDAIDYFNTYAGFDENGIQTGPMAGGVVIFAAGNDAVEISYPSEYEGCISVTAVGFDAKASYYTNFGAWSDIAATGGDTYKDPMILSTLPGNQYGYMQGTSMACPHVSGVAALIIANYGGKGFTNTMLKEKLLSTTKEKYLYRHNSTFSSENQLGIGLIDAYASLAGRDSEIPEKVEGLKHESNIGNLKISWIVPKKGSNGIPKGFSIFYSKEDLKTFDPDKDTINVSQIDIPVSNVKAGDKIEYILPNLGYEQTYNIRVAAFSDAIVYGQLSDQLTATTRSNTPPYINPLDGDNFTIKKHEKKTFRFEYGDIDSNSIHISGNLGSSAAEGSYNNSMIYITIDGTKANPGNYKGTLTADDQNGGVSEITFSYTILPNHSPELIEDIPSIMMNKSENIEIDLNRYFKDIDGEILKFSALSSCNNAIVTSTISENKLSITSKSYGISNVTVKATDSLQLHKSYTFQVIVRDMSVPFDVYPNPVVDFLYIRSISTEPCSFTITNTMGGKVMAVNNITINPFDPYVIDIRAWEPGEYSIVLNLSGTTYRKSIVKL